MSLGAVVVLTAGVLLVGAVLLIWALVKRVVGHALIQVERLTDDGPEGVSGGPRAEGK